MCNIKDSPLVCEVITAGAMRLLQLGLAKRGVKNYGPSSQALALRIVDSAVVQLLLGINVSYYRE